MDGSSVSISDLREDIIACLAVGGIPAVVGPPGCGKTAMAGDLARLLDLNFVVVIGSISEPTDIAGFPVVVTPPGAGEPVLKFAVRDWVQRLDQDTRGALVLYDELTTVSGAVMNTMLTSCLSKRFGDYQADPHKMGMMVAYNPADVAMDGRDLGPAMANRLTHFEYPTGIAARKEWCDQFPGYWGNPKKVGFNGKFVDEEHMIRARSYVAGFLARAPVEFWYAMPKETSAAAKAWPSPRSWEVVAWYLGWCLQHNKPVISSYRRVAGAIGAAAAIEFQTFMRETSLPDPEEVLRHANKYEPSGRVDVDWATLSAVAAAIDHNPTIDRVLAGTIVMNRAVSNRGEGGPAYEVGMGIAPKIVKWTAPHRQETLLKGQPPSEVAAKIGEIHKLMKPFSALQAKMGTI